MRDQVSLRSEKATEGTFEQSLEEQLGLLRENNACGEMVRIAFNVRDTITLAYLIN